MPVPGNPCGTFAPVERSAPIVRAVLAGAVLLLAAGPLAGCGSSDNQASGEPTGDFTVAVTSSFPRVQAYAKNARLVISVVNRSGKTIPNVTATVDGLYDASTQQGMADPRQPVWIVNVGPRNGVTALTNTWALGAMPPGARRTFTWNVTPMQSGLHRLHYRVNASLYGNSRAVLASGAAPERTYNVLISSRASATKVDPATGKVVVTGVVPKS